MNCFLRPFFVCLLMLFSVSAFAQTQPEMHKVAKHETVYGIAHQYGLTEQELISANPEMSLPDFKLKKGFPEKSRINSTCNEYSFNKRNRNMRSNVSQNKGYLIRSS